MINPWGGELRTARMSEVVTSGTCVHWVILHLSRAVWSSAVVSIEVDESCERIVRADATMLPALALCHYCVRHAEPQVRVEVGLMSGLTSGMGDSVVVRGEGNSRGGESGVTGDAHVDVIG